MNRMGQQNGWEDLMEQDLQVYGQDWSVEWMGGFNGVGSVGLWIGLISRMDGLI